MSKKKEKSKSLSVVLDDETYKLRRLSTDDIEEFGDIFTSVLAGAEFRGVDLNLKKGEDGDMSDGISEVLMKGMPFAMKEITAWLRTIPMDYPEDQPIFLPDFPVLVGALVKHPDIGLFFERFNDLLQMLSSLVGSYMNHTTQTA